jgi:hypothetical protein
VEVPCTKQNRVVTGVFIGILLILECYSYKINLYVIFGNVVNVATATVVNPETD